MSVPNFCQPGVMSSCTAGISWEQQNKCFFSEKSKDHNRCMFFMGEREADDNICDCFKAQMTDYNPVVPDKSGLTINLPEFLPREHIREGIVVRHDNGYAYQRSSKPIDISKVKIKKICPLDRTSICAKSVCTHWDFCKEPIKNA